VGYGIKRTIIVSFQPAVELWAYDAAPENVDSQA
jgi:hypothetical protein